jgi:hypothetical protein
VRCSEADRAEKPLHVRVAEICGYHQVHHCKEHATWEAVWPGGPAKYIREHWPVPRYDTDWSATGPLIEQYHIDLWWENTPGDGQWTATTNFRDGGDLIVTGTGPTPLIAVCHLILALKEAGKLEAA